MPLSSAVTVVIKSRCTTRFPLISSCHEPGFPLDSAAVCVLNQGEMAKDFLIKKAWRNCANNLPQFCVNPLLRVDCQKGTLCFSPSQKFQQKFRPVFCKSSNSSKVTPLRTSKESRPSQSTPMRAKTSIGSSIRPLTSQIALFKMHGCPRPRLRCPKYRSSWRGMRQFRFWRRLYRYLTKWTHRRPFYCLWHLLPACWQFALQKTR